MVSFPSHSSIRARPPRVELLPALDVRINLYYFSLGLLKQETALSQKAAFRKLFIVGFSYALHSIGFKKIKGIWASLCTISVSASLQRVERKNRKKSGKLEKS